MVKYEYEILKLVVAPSINSFSDVVTKVNWRFQVTEGGYFADKYFVTEISEPKDTFISFNELTDQQVFSWISEIENIEDLKNQLLDKLEKEKNPSSVEKDVPWNKTSYLADDKFLIVVDGDPNEVNKVKGPFSWDSGVANNFLASLGIDYQFPATGVMFSKTLLPGESPLVINERVAVYKALYDNINDFDKDYYSITSVFWDISTGKAIGTYSIESKQLNAIKESIKNTIEEYYKKKKLVSIPFEDQFTILTIDKENPEEQVTKINTSIYTNEDVYLEAIGKLSIMNENEVVRCRVNSLDNVTVNFEIMKKIVKTIVNHYKKVADWKAEVLKSVESASSIEELQSIELSIREA